MDEPGLGAKAEPVPYSHFGDPQSLNLYGYVENNPLSVADADGHCGSASPISCGEAEDRIADSAAVQEQARTQLKEDNLRYAQEKEQANKAAAQQQKLEVVPTKNSTAARPEVNFHLTQPSEHGGIIVQEITITNAGGEQTSHWWEAWPVFKGHQGTAYLERGLINADDHFTYYGSGDHITASARYYDGSALEDGGFITPGGPGTHAGNLPATTSSPNLPTSNATTPVDRTFTAP